MSEQTPEPKEMANPRLRLSDGKHTLTLAVYGSTTFLSVDARKQSSGDRQGPPQYDTIINIKLVPDFIIALTDQLGHLISKGNPGDERPIAQTKFDPGTRQYSPEVQISMAYRDDGVHFVVTDIAKGVTAEIYPALSRRIQLGSEPMDPITRNRCILRSFYNQLVNVLPMGAMMTTYKRNFRGSNPQQGASGSNNRRDNIGGRSVPAAESMSDDFFGGDEN